jgi:hypothetical protein
VSVPTSDDFGYGEAGLVITVQPAATKALVAINTNQSVWSHTASSAQLAENYFRQGDAHHYCTSVRPEDVDHCRSDVIADTKNAVEGIRKALDKMKTAPDKAAFVKAYAELGKNALKNEFSMASFFRLTPVEMTYTIQGEKIAILKKKLASRN